MAAPRKLPNGKWIVQIRLKGHAPVSKTFPTKLQAETWSFETRQNMGKVAVTGKTLRDALERYAKEISPEHKGQRWEQVRLHAFARYPISNMQIDKITTEDLQRWISDRASSVKSSTIRRELNLFSAVFSAAIKQWKWCSDNPVKNTRKPAAVPHRDRIMSDAEITSILAALGYSEDSPVVTQQQHIGCALLISLETAMRQGELWGLTWDDVFLEKRYVRLQETKNGTSRNVPLSSKAVALFESIQKKSGRVIPYPQESCAQMFRAAVKLCGITNLTWHDARHTSITRLARKLQPLELAKMVGHKNLSMLLVYYNESATSIAQRLD